MKKFNLALLSILTIILTSVLVGCNFKKVEASFSEAEIRVSVDKPINLDEYLTVQGADKSEISYRFEDSNLFSIQDRVITPNASGKSKVHAVYQENSIATMQIIVRQFFSAPTGFEIKQTAQGCVLTWRAVSGIYAGESEAAPTMAESYRVTGRRVTYSVENPKEVESQEEIDEIVNDNKFVFKENVVGEYHLFVRAMTTGDFDETPLDLCEEQVCYIGYMPNVPASALRWDNGEFSWTGAVEEDARYQVRVDGNLYGGVQEETTINLKDYFDEAEEGEHTLSVVVYDKNTGSNSKYPNESETLTIKKLSKPNVEGANGQIQISTEDDETKEFVLELTAQGGETLSPRVLKYDGKVVTTPLEGLSTGVYHLNVTAKASGLYYHSKSADFGYVYKLGKLTLTGAGEDEVNKTIFHANAEIEESKVNTNFVLKRTYKSQTSESNVNGLSAGVNSKNLSIQIILDGKHEVSAYATARMARAQIDGIPNVFVLDSDESESIVVTKLSEFIKIQGEDKIVHSYAGENFDKSVLKFAIDDESATKFELYYDDVKIENGYVEGEDGNYKTFTFDKRLEEKFTVKDGVFKFKIVAKTNNDNYAINSYAEKEIFLLGSLTMQEREITDKTFTWNKVANAEKYKVTVYRIDSDTYDSVTDVDTSKLQVAYSEEVEENFISFDELGVDYYLVEVAVISADENKFITDGKVLSEKIIVAEKLEIGAVNFGYDETLVNAETGASGYFLQIGKIDNAKHINLTVNSVSDGGFDVADIENGKYNLTQDFSAVGATRLSLIATANGDRRYLNSDAVSLTVERLKTLAFNPLNETTSDILFDKNTEKVSVKAVAGATEMLVTLGDNSDTALAGEMAEVPVPRGNGANNFTLSVRLKGSERNETTKLYSIANGRIYLGNDSSFEIRRLATPTGLRYYNNQLIFTNNDANGIIGGYFVLNVSGETLNEGQNFNISVRFQNPNLVIYVNDSALTTNEVSANYISVSDTSNDVYVNFGNLLNLLQAKYSDLYTAYAQLSEVNFSLFAYQSMIQNNTIVIASPDAKVQSGAGANETKLKIQKMSSTTLSIERGMESEETNLTFAWDEVELSNSSLNAETEYVIFCNNAEIATLKGVNTHAIAKSSTVFAEYNTNYTIRVLVRNPNYLESEFSNLISVYKLVGISSVGLTDKGNLDYIIPTANMGNFDEVVVTYNDGTSTTTLTLEENGQVKLVGAGQYTFKLTGKQEDGAYYIGSPLATWTVGDMSELAPEDTTITVDNNTIKWNAFGKNNTFDSLEYVLIFKDVNGKTHLFSTTQTSVDLASLANELSGLAEGDVQLQLTAHFKAHYSATTDTIYYSEAQTLLNGSETIKESNYFVYTQTSDASYMTIKKLMTPNIVGVEFVHDDKENNSDAQSADVTINFEGNYGENGIFSIHLGVVDINRVEIAGVAKEGVEGMYVYSYTFTNSSLTTLTDSAVLTVQALSDVANAIPSQTLKCDIERAGNLNAVSFENDREISQTLYIKLAGDKRTSGGVILKVDWQANGGESQTEYIKCDGDSASTVWEYSMTEFFANNLVAGGAIQVSAFVNNFADNVNHTYYLASQGTVSSKNYTILQAVDASKVVTSPEGFTIEDAETINTAETIYVAEYYENLEKKTQELTSENEYSFIFPNSWGNNAEGYPVTIYARNEGDLPSVAVDVKVSLQRISEVDGISMQRAGKEITLSWKAVDGASGYVLNVYKVEDGEKGELIYKYNLSKTTVTLDELFGADYSDFIETGKVTEFDLLGDLQLMFGLVTVGTETIDNSKEFNFNAVIRGKELSDEQMIVDENGMLKFNGVDGEKYIYKFEYILNGEEETIPEEFAWTNLVGREIDFTKLPKEVTRFRVQIAVAGNSPEEATPYQGGVLEFVSLPHSFGVYTFSYTINEIKVSAFNSNMLTFDLEGVGDYKILAGLTENAIYDSAQVVEINPVDSTVGGEAGLKVYALADLIDELQKLGTVSEIYFWTYTTAGEGTGTDINVISRPYKDFSISLNGGLLFNSIVKVGVNPVDTSITEDYINTFALFDNTDDDSVKTVGFNVKITQKDGETFIKFVTAREALNNEYYGAFDGEKQYFAINLTKLFEETDLLNLDGQFKVEFSKLSTLNGAYEISPWLVADNNGKEYAFTRLSAVQNLELKNGNLQWSASSDDTQFFKVYFISALTGLTPDIYSTYTARRNFLYASDYVGDRNSYFLAVQGVHDNAFMLSSQRTFIVNGEKAPVRVVKNQIKRSLTLKDGVMAFDWGKDNEIVSIIRSDNTDLQQLALSLYDATFTIPFTFSLSDIAEEKLTVRFEFTPVAGGNAQSFDVNANLLLANLFKEEDFEDIKDMLERVAASVTGMVQETEIRKAITAFIDVMENGSNGVASAKSIFDDNFENLQVGAYNLRYCLLGGTFTLNSGWYTYENPNVSNDGDKGLFYVNAQPKVSAKRETSRTERGMNSYKVIFKLGDIYTYNNAYTTTTAESYVMRLGGYVFTITKGSSQYTLKMIYSENKEEIPEGNISVMRCDENGNQNSAGSYLMFYLNHNRGDSLLGVYGDYIENKRYNMEISAVGNAYSASSKSECFWVNFLSFDESLSMVDGTFVWTPTENRKTTVIYKKDTSNNEGVDNIEVSEASATSTYSLSGLGAGYYNYIKFVVEGEIAGNVINVDSSIYRIDNIYKLWSPTLSTQFGNLTYNASRNKQTSEAININNCYSSSELYSYILSNNISINEETGSYLYSKISDMRATNLKGTLNSYEVGTTGLAESDVNYDYKETELTATEFSMYMLGTNAEFTYPNYSDNKSEYHIKRIAFDAGESGKTAVAVRSDINKETNAGYIKASMVDMVTDVRTDDGNLTWRAVSGRTVNDENLTPITGANIVYRILVDMYIETNTDTGSAEHNILETKAYYTTDTTFDFSIIEKNETLTLYDNVLIKVTVQAMGMFVGEYLPGSQSYVALENGGGYAYGSPTYADAAGQDTEAYMLMGNGSVLSEISRINPIDENENSPVVRGGRIVWTYTVNSASINVGNFREYYDFIVTDDKDREIKGRYTLTQQDYTFTVTFTANQGEIPSGLSFVKVYVNQGTNKVEKIIKSFASSALQVNKLSTITQDDFQIDSQANYETLDFTSYFEANPNNYITMTTSTNETFAFGRTDGGYILSKLLICNSIPSGTFPLPDDYYTNYVSGYLVIDDVSAMELEFVVTDDGKSIVSDISEKIALERANWQEDSAIEWDAEQGMFTWNYNRYAFAEETSAQQVEKGFTLANTTTLYTDINCTSSSASGSLPANSRIYIKSVAGSTTEIYYDEETRQSVPTSETSRFITASYREGWIDIVGEPAVFGEDKVFSVVEELIGQSVVEIDGRNYKVNTSSIAKPLFILDVVYTVGNVQEQRTYTTTDKAFKPTIVADKVDISIRIKLNENSIQSSSLTYVGNAVMDLFASGEGTELNPYIIRTTQQFKNIAYRMTKDINTYNSSTGEAVTEEEMYYFSIVENIDLSDEVVNGILFAGEFSGIIKGNNNSITYKSNGVAKMQDTLTVNSGDTMFHLSQNRADLKFDYGSALFERLTYTSYVKDLNINVIYQLEDLDPNKWIPNHAIMAGLALINNGAIENVNLTGFNTNFLGRVPGSATLTIMAYAGVVAKNQGIGATVSNCALKTNMDIKDAGAGLAIFVGGITLFNYEAIRNCSVDDGVVISITETNRDSGLQVAGIVMSSSNQGAVTGCANNGQITLTTSSSTGITGFISGVVVCGRNDITNNTFGGTVNISSTYTGVKVSRINSYTE